MKKLASSLIALPLLLAFACGESSKNAAPNGAGAAGASASAGATSGGSTSTDAGAHSGGAAAASGQSTAGGGAGVSGGADAGSAGEPAGGAEGCEPKPVEPVTCQDLIGSGIAARASVTTEDGASAAFSEVGGALRLVTESGFLVTLRLKLEQTISTTNASILRLLVRAKNTNTGWQGNVPVVSLEDVNGKRVSYTPAGPRYPSDGETWRQWRIPIAGGDGWEANFEGIDVEKISVVELTADTWESGFTLDLDQLGFVERGVVCDGQCSNDCSARGECQLDSLGCVCEVGAAGDDCATCRAGFTLKDGHCSLTNDGDYDYWPNAVSQVNGDAWLQVHHQAIRTLKPKVLALNFVNPSVPEDVEALLVDVIAGFREGSRPLGQGEPGLDYDLVDVVDLRDGVAGRPAPPVDYPYQNSTLYPRRPQGEPGWGFDYAQLFSQDFAEHYGFEQASLCELVESGRINELWIVGSGDVPDANAAEVLEHKQRYDAGRNPVPDTFERCAGNGCFDLDVPRCARSIRIGFVNYNRGPGCYLHSQGHGLESTARGAVLPSLSEWFLPLGGFDLDRRYGLPGQSFYELMTEQTKAEYPAPNQLDLIREGTTLRASDYVASCGNVHFPPNAGDDYDYASSVPVLSDCADFGRNAASCRSRATAPVSASDWAGYEELSPDCGGAFLVWWFQHLPGHDSQQLFDDGRPMLSAWPFFFY